MVDVIITNPVYDLYPEAPERNVLWYAEPYFEQIKKYLEEKKVPHEYLYKEDAVFTKVWDVMSKNSIIYITGVGHGGHTYFTGYLVKLIFWCDGMYVWRHMMWNGYLPEWHYNTVFLILSCLTASVLGPWFRRYGAWSYLGWNHYFYFCARIGKRKGKDWKETPEMLWHKPVEEAFKKCIAAEITPKEAYDYIYRKFTEYLESSEIPELFKVFLQWDRDHMVLIGHEDHPPKIRERRLKEKAKTYTIISSVIASTAGILLGYLTKKATVGRRVRVA